MFCPDLQLLVDLTAVSLWCWKAKPISSVFLKSQWEVKKRSHTHDSWSWKQLCCFWWQRAYFMPYVTSGKSICSKRTEPERNLSQNFKNNTSSLIFVPPNVSLCAMSWEKDEWFAVDCVTWEQRQSGSKLTTAVSHVFNNIKRTVVSKEMPEPQGAPSLTAGIVTRDRKCHVPHCICTAATFLRSWVSGDLCEHSQNCSFPNYYGNRSRNVRCLSQAQTRLDTKNVDHEGVTSSSVHRWNGWVCAWL